MRVEDLTLPVIDREIEIAAEGSRSGFKVDLGRHTCSCPGWFGNRRQFKDGDLKLCCAHMAAAFVTVFSEGVADDSPRILKDLLAERTRRGRGVDHKSQWKLLKLRMRPHLISFGGGDWSSVYAYDAKTDFQRFAYDRDAGRWSFGAAPQGHVAMVDFLSRSKSKSQVFS